MTYCPKCGAEVSHNDQFCMKCGSKLAGAPSEAASAAAAAAAGGAAAENDILGLIAKAQAGVAAQKEEKDPAQPQAPGDVAPEKAPAQQLAADTRAATPAAAEKAPDAPAAQTPPAPAPGRQVQPPVNAGAGPGLFDATGQVPVQQPGAPVNLFGGAVPPPQTGPFMNGAPPVQQPQQRAAAPANLFDTQQRPPVQGQYQNMPPQQRQPQQRPPRQGRPQQAGQQPGRQQAPVQSRQRPPMQRQPMPGGGQPPVNTQPFAAGQAPGGFSPPQGAGQGTQGGGLFGEAAGPYGPRGGQPPRQMAPAVAMPMQPPARGGGGKKAAKILIFILVFLVLTAGVTFGMLYFIYSPGNTTNDFGNAIAERNITKLKSMTLVEGEAPTDAQWNAFCDAFFDSSGNVDENAISDLKSALNDRAGGKTVPGYEAVGMQGQDFIIPLITPYKVTLSRVAMLAPGATDGTLANLNGVDYTGTATAEGMVYSGLVPGRYTCKLVPPGADASQVEGIYPVDLFKTDAPNAIEGTLQRATLTIENCLSDDAILFVNEVPVEQRPVGGVVTIPNVALGSTVRISLTQGGVQMEATVVYTSPGVTTLRFDNYTEPPAPAPGPGSSSVPASEPAPATLTADEINTLMGTFYASYLDCINAQSMEHIKLSTDANNRSLEERIKLEANATRLFQFVSVAVDADTIKTGTSGGVPSIEFEMIFSYNHKPRDSGSYTAGSNRQSVELLYQDGQWLVNRFEYVSDDAFELYGAGVFGGIPVVAAFLGRTRTM